MFAQGRVGLEVTFFALLRLSHTLVLFQLRKKKKENLITRTTNHHISDIMTSVADAVVPGQRLGHVQEYAPGSGTYLHQDFLYASVVGLKQISVSGSNEVNQSAESTGMLTMVLLVAIACWASKSQLISRQFLVCALGLKPRMIDSVFLLDSVVANIKCPTRELAISHPRDRCHCHLQGRACKPTIRLSQHHGCRWQAMHRRLSGNHPRPGCAGHREGQSQDLQLVPPRRHRQSSGGKLYLG